MFGGGSEPTPDPFLAGNKKAGHESSDLPWSLWGSSSPRREPDPGRIGHGARQSQARRDGQSAMMGGPLEARQKEREQRVYRERVLVRVYDLGKTVVTKGLNRAAKSMGAFHSGVEIYGREWSFGMTFDEWSTGITWNPPGENPDHTYLETLSMGYTSKSPTEVWQLIEEMKAQWRGHTYHLLTRNCHHFSDAFCQKLGVARIPPWLNDLAGTGAATVEFLDTADSGYDGGEAISDFFSSMKRGLYNALSWESSDTKRSEPLPQPKAYREEEWAAQSPQRPEPRHDPFLVLRR